MPKLKKLRLDNFSIYNAAPLIEVKFNDGAFCVVGANGLGKSTFLNTLNFALTGIVPDPERGFLSVMEYYDYSKSFAESYFDGRIGEAERDVAEVYVEFEAGDKLFQLSRGFFEREGLRALQITGPNGPLITDGNANAATALHQLYTEVLPKEIGLTSFDQFVFLQHFVFTFDERRHLLFWDQKLLEQVLHLCFGLDPVEAQHADNLRRDAERAESLARNYQWQATELRRKLEELEAILKGDKKVGEKGLKLAEQYAEMQAKRDVAQSILIKTRAQKDDAELALAQATAAVASKKQEYEEEFSKRFSRQGSIELNPILVSTLESSQCEVCGTKADAVPKNIHSKLSKHICPLCDAPVSGTQSGTDVRVLKTLDKELGEAHGKLKQVSARFQRLQQELAAADEKFRSWALECDQFEEQNARALKALLASGSSTLQSTISGYKDQVDSILNKKQEQLDKRNEKRRELTKLRKKLINAYSDAEVAFVPAFRELAHSFLGIDLDVRIETTAIGVSLTLEVRDTARRFVHQLSESQRFFIDIALRMALIQITSPSARTASLLIDTPEGSLDIAYESRAGDMFAKFVESGFRLILTANINTSQLLLSLAARCGKKKLELCRMTSWTELSEVQQAEEWRFDEAYRKIVAALEGQGKSLKSTK